MGLPAAASVVAALDVAYSAVTAVVTALDDDDLLLPTRCRGWSIADLTLHLTLDAQRALIAFATPADTGPDVDHVTYWHGRSGAGDPADALAHGQWVRRSAAAFNRPGGVVGRWTETAPAAVRAAAAADPALHLRTQGHVLAVPEFVATLIVEAVIHHLDLIVSLPDAPEPPAEAVAIVVSIMDALSGPGGLPPGWDHRETLLKGSGRVDLDDADRRVLGERASRFPLIG